MGHSHFGVTVKSQVNLIRLWSDSQEKITSQDISPVCETFLSIIIPGLQQVTWPQEAQLHCLFPDLRRETKPMVTYK